MKIAFISDTHMSELRNSEMPDADILLHAGDGTYRGTISEVQRLAKNLGQLKYEKIIFIPGNHDFLFEKEPELAVKIMEEEGIKVLINKEYVYKGIKFWGSPVTSPFCNWAFNWNDEKRLHLWEQIPEDTDIVITHGPPKFIGDQIIYRNKVDNVGCQFLRNRIQKIKPKIHLFGHIHEGYGEEEIDGVIYINASYKDEFYKDSNKVIVKEFKCTH